MKTEEKREKVVVKYNGMTGWDISYPGRGIEAVRPGAEVEFDPRDPAQLHVLLGIIKEVNRPRTNERISLTRAAPDGFQEQLKIPKFEILKGRELLPDVLLKHKYSASNMLTNDEVDAIRDLCPKYLDRKHERLRMVL